MRDSETYRTERCLFITSRGFCKVPVYRSLPFANVHRSFIILNSEFPRLEKKTDKVELENQKYNWFESDGRCKIYQNNKKHVLTFLRVRTDLEVGGSSEFLFIQIDGTDPGRSVRWEPSTCRLLSKHSSAKCSEQTMNCPWGLKFARWVLTNLAHLSCALLFFGLMCTEIPPSRLGVLLHPWTTHRRPGIFFRLSKE